MATLRKFVAYRRLERPYTRFSKYTDYSFVRARPASKVVRYVMGDLKSSFPYTVVLMAKGAAGWQIRDNAIESARLTSLRKLEKALGKTGYILRVRIYPHHVLRENPLAAGAGADRMSTGMAHSFGKPIGVAAQVKPGQVIMDCNITKDKLEIAKQALKRAAHKLPNSYFIQVIENKKKQ